MNAIVDKCRSAIPVRVQLIHDLRSTYDENTKKAKASMASAFYEVRAIESKAFEAAVELGKDLETLLNELGKHEFESWVESQDLPLPATRLIRMFRDQIDLREALEETPPGEPLPNRIRLVLRPPETKAPVDPGRMKPPTQAQRIASLQQALDRRSTFSRSIGGYEITAGVVLVIHECDIYLFALQGTEPPKQLEPVISSYRVPEDPAVVSHLLGVGTPVEAFETKGLPFGGALADQRDLAFEDRAT